MRHGPVHQILKPLCERPQFKANRVRHAPLHFLRNLRRGQMRALSVIAIGGAASRRLFPQQLQPLLGAEAAVRRTPRQQFLNMMMI